SVAWGDYDNDGDLDIALTGNTGTARISKLYRNDAGVFKDPGIALTGLSESSVAWGDYDGDGDVDILLAGNTGSAAVAKIYRVNCGDPNTLPSAPTGLRVQDLGSDIVLSWEAAGDGQTPSAGLSYNIRIGTAPGLDNVKPAMTDRSTGKRRIPGLGNVNSCRTWIVKGLTRGVNYYWSVQAVDSAWLGGRWASDQLIRLSSAPMNWYVDAARPNDEGDGWSWQTAKKTIQAAVTEARDGDNVWVAQGVYNTGGLALPGRTVVNRVCVTNAVKIYAVAGPARTFIVGSGDVTNGLERVRCVYMSANGLIAGFTLIAGQTLNYGEAPWEVSGAGALLTDGVLSNCLIRANVARSDGGGVQLWGGGRIELSTVRENQAETGNGGGIHARAGGTIRGCLVTENTADNGGGGGIYLAEAGGTVQNCTVVANRANQGGGVCCNGGGTVVNSVIRNNTALSADSNWHANGGGHFAFCATTPVTGLPGGEGCVDNDPRFVNPTAGNYRLRYGSPCIDTASNLVTILRLDLDGKQRPLDGNGDGTAAFDMGAYEYDLLTADSNGDGIPDLWYHTYGLDAGAPDVAQGNPDNDAFTTGEEYVADTDPTNASSFFRIEAVSNSPVWTVWFRSSTRRVYRLFYTPTLTNVQWRGVTGASNVWGNGTILGLGDPNTTVTGRFYRVGVSLP
ncbi:MAG: fibronectin type III domain-containing protein, partial [Kiritimatiellae bacterium]|nr:fibronectin type III domain-containing protein [Kiritimatiellia bacterium]